MSRRKSGFDNGSVWDSEPQDEPVSMLEVIEETGQLRRGRRKVYHVLGVLVGLVIGVVLVAVAVSQNLSRDPDSSPAISIPSINIPSFDIPSLDIPDLGELQLKVGDCFQYPSDGDVLSATSVPCGEPHTAQLYALIQSIDGTCNTDLLNHSVLPAGAQPMSTTVMDSTGFEVACYVKTPSMTGSAMAS